MYGNFHQNNMKTFILHRMYILIEQECEFLANMPKMSYARLIKMLLNESTHFLHRKWSSCLNIIEKIVRYFRL